MLKICVCMKQIIDPEAPVSLFQVDEEARRVIPPKGTPPVLSPFDGNALEAALRIKDTREAKVTVLSMGWHLAQPVIKKSLVAGADELILIDDDAFKDLDSYSTAYILAQAIKMAGGYDLILCGRQAADMDAGQVGSGIAEMLGIPCITIARKLDISDGKVRVERVLSDGYEVIETSMPVMVTVSNEVGELRYPTIKDVMKAQQKPTTIWNSEELGIDLSLVKRSNLLRLFIPVCRKVECQLIEGETQEDAAVNLALELKKAGII